MLEFDTLPTSWVGKTVRVYVTLLLISISAFGQSDTSGIGSWIYPKPALDTFSYTRHGIKVDDPYRWFDTKESKKDLSNWLKDQKELVKQYASGFKYEGRIKENIQYYGGFRRLSLMKQGGYYFRYLGVGHRTSGPAVFYRKHIHQVDELLFNPAIIAEKDRLSLDDISLSKSENYLALFLTRNENEDQEIRVLDMDTRELLDDNVKEYDYSDVIGQENGFAWRGAGFYYVHDGTLEASAPIDLKTFEVKKGDAGAGVDYVYYHKLGTKQYEDKPIFANKRNYKSHLNVFVTPDERFLVVIDWDPVSDKTNVYVDDFEDGTEGVSLLLRGVKGYIKFLDNIGDRLLLITDIHRDNKWLAYLDPKRPSELIPALNLDESGAILKTAFVAGERIITVYVADDKQVMLLFDFKGKLQHSFLVDEGKSFSDFMGRKGDSELFITIESKTDAELCGVYDLEKNEFVYKIATDQQRFNPDDYIYQRHLVPTSDSVDVPLVTIRHKKHFNTNGNNPTLLTAYGGFGLVSEPWFDPSIIYLLENGGVYAEAHVRGGGELGSTWHKQGMGLNKRNTINDFISSAEFLIENKYTTPQKLAITGQSHGGFVVGTAAVMRPDLFRVAIPRAGLYNMVDYARLSAEYGGTLDSLDFANRYQLSAYYQAQKAHYPSMMFITAGNDPRVRPMQSYKMVARLQEQTLSPNPVLLYKFGSGHYQAYSYSTWIRLRTSMLSFMFGEMGVKPKL